MTRIAVLGSGAWGTALALALAPRHQVTLWSHRPEHARDLALSRENRHFLPGFALPPSIKITGDDTAISDADILVSVIPSQFLRPTIARLAPNISARQILVSATKGIEDTTYLRMTQVIRESLIRQTLPVSLPIGALSGPSFAQEVAQGQPTAITIAFAQPNLAARIQREFSSPTLRLYTTDDLIGVEMGGALKNVIAIAAGVASGLGLGANSSAALITRGIAEITRLAVASGAQPETLSGLSGIGDLILTCSGALSRNRTVGQKLGQGQKLPEILASLNGKVAEGISTTRAALGLARKLNVEMPITQQMQQILDQNKDPKSAIKELMQRPTRDEAD